MILTGDAVEYAKTFEELLAKDISNGSQLAEEMNESEQKVLYTIMRYFEVHQVGRPFLDMCMKFFLTCENEGNLIHIQFIMSIMQILMKGGEIEVTEHYPE